MQFINNNAFMYDDANLWKDTFFPRYAARFLVQFTLIFVTSGITRGQHLLRLLVVIG